MTSARKAASNRTNAWRSSGPRTLGGKIHSSRNARKHGLTVPITGDQTWVQKIESLALEIAGKDPDHLRLEGARISAEAELDLVRVRAARAHLFELSGIVCPARPQSSTRKASSIVAPPEPERDDGPNLITNEELGSALEQIILLDRYERRALARRNRAIRRLSRQ